MCKVICRLQLKSHTSACLVCDLSPRLHEAPCSWRSNNCTLLRPSLMTDGSVCNVWKVPGQILRTQVDYRVSFRGFPQYI